MAMMDLGEAVQTNGLGCSFLRSIVVGDGLDELSDAGDGEAFELPSREFTEEALNEIQPRGGGRGEVELHSRVFLEPYPNSRMLVRGVVVENDVDVELGRDGPLDLTEESQEFLMPMARHAFVEDLASGHVQSSEEGRGTVTFVVMRLYRFRFPGQVGGLIMPPSG